MDSRSSVKLMDFGIFNLENERILLYIGDHWTLCPETSVQTGDTRGKEVVEMIHGDHKT